MAIDYMPIGALPTLSDLSGGDLIPVAHNGVASALNAAALTRNASASAAGRMSADDKSKLDGIQAGAQVNAVTGVKGASESSYRTGNINLTPANIGAVPTSRTVNGKALSSDITVDKSDVGLGNVDNTKDADKPVSTATLAALNEKVDKVTGKGLSMEDYTTAEKTKLAGIEDGAEVNEVTAEDYQVIVAKAKALETQNGILKKQLENLLAGLEIPIYINASGVGVVDFEDAAAGQIRSVTVDPSLSGQKVYIQLANSGGLTDTTGTVGSGGAVTLAAPLSTLRGRNLIYVTTATYTFPPTGAGHGPHTGGTYVNSHTDENGRQAYDAWIPKNGIAAAVRYVRDADLGGLIDREISYEEFLATVGYGVNYIQVSDPTKYHNAGAPLYIKLEGYPFATQDKPVYSRVNYPTSNAKVFYIPEYYPLT